MNRLAKRCWLAAALAGWWLSTPAAVAQTPETETTTIIVTAEREREAEVAGDLAREVTLNPPIDKPMGRFYAPLCVMVFGLDPNFSEVIAERVTANARTLGLAVGGTGCQPNAWIGFVSNSRAEVEVLREREPAMFSQLANYQIDRILAGSDAVQAWHAFETRNADGRPIQMIRIEVQPGVWREAPATDQYQAGRLTPPIRVDMIGAIVLFDRQLTAGRTIRQLADHATFRILASVTDSPQAEPGEVGSILSLFAPGTEAEPGLTEFDWAYLAALYKLGRGAERSAMHDAVRRTILDGTGERLAAEAERN